MNDRAIGLLDQYELEVLKTRKGRGAILCDTPQGCFILRENKGSEERCGLQDRLLRRIREDGRVCAESILPTREGRLLARDKDGTSYMLKTYFEGRECNVYDRKECIEAVRVLARLHESMELPKEAASFPCFLPGQEYEKHNREMKKVRQYLHKKGQKAWFEICLQQSLDYFLKQAEEVTEEWSHYSHLTERQPECCGFCHGDYQYHNIVWVDDRWCVVNFEKCMRDNPIRDLYLLLRKLLEKSDWSLSLGRDLLGAYDEVRPLSAYSRLDLYYRLAYPEKFWKVLNFYYNSGKAWIPAKNLEKLQKLLDQENDRQNFLDEIFRKL